MADRAVRVRAPAKVNLSLRIVGRRADGYHLLDSLMVPIGLYDDLTVAARPSGQPMVRLSVTGPVPAGDDNLASQAARHFLARTARCVAIDLTLQKNIPVGSGLGGGSSDAATVLRTLNRLLGTGVAVDQLAAWGAELGADVPFFIQGGPARVQGIGEVVTPVDGYAGLALVVAYPGEGLSTREIYRKFDERRPTEGATAMSASSLTNRRPETSIANFAGSHRLVQELLVNDLEAVAAEAYPALSSLKDQLGQLGAQGALMTGSGSAVFGIWPTRGAAGEAAERLRGQGVWAVAVETLGQRPTD